LAQIAKTAMRETIALRALSRVDDSHMLGSIARHGCLETVRLQALDALKARHDHAELLATALNSDFKDSGVAAVDTITERYETDQLTAREKKRKGGTGARAAARGAEGRGARPAVGAAAAAPKALTPASPAVVDPQADTASPPHGDPLAVAPFGTEDAPSHV